MRHYNICLLKRLSFAVLMLAIIVAGIGVERTYAAANGIYTATAYPHYRHPGTGVIEDSGGESSYEIGQGMTESALHNVALVEVDPSGNTFITLRMKLMDNIENPSFQVDAAGNGSFYSVGAQLMQEDYGAHTCDFRMQVPSEDAVIRCEMRVIPMGRWVIFYITVGGLSSGAGDFIPSVTVEEPSAPAPEAPQTNGDTAQPQTGDADNGSQGDAGSTQSEAEKPNNDSSQPAEDKPQQDDKRTTTDGKEVGSKTGISEFDAAGNRVDTTKPEKSDGGGKTAAVLAVIGVVVLGGGGYAGFRFFRKRKGRG